MNRTQGFTFIEILLVVSIVGILMSITVPASYSMYKRYEASLKAEKVLTLVASLRLQSFLHSEENTLSSKEGRLLINQEVYNLPEDVFVQIDQPIRFFKTGATQGGAMKIHTDEFSFVIDISAPFGEMTMNLQRRSSS